MAGRKFLRFHSDLARNYCDRRAALFAVWQVLSHLPAACAVGRQTLSAGWGRGQRSDLRSLWRTLRFAHARGGSQESSPADGFQLFDARTRQQLARTLPGVQAQINFACAIATERGSEWLRPP